MARMFQRTNAQKLLDQESSTTGAKTASNSARLDVLEEDFADLDERVTDAEETLEDHQTVLDDHEGRIAALETP